MQTLVGSGKTVKKLLLPPSLYIALITIARMDLSAPGAILLGWNVY